MMDERILKDVRVLRHRLHENPERSMQEEKTRGILLEFLRTHTHTLEIADRGEWFYAVKRGRSGEAPIAFRADFDAVTCADGTARHLCGHDGHSAVLAGLALMLDRTRPPRDVYLIFQPGEESGQGAKLCAGLCTEKGIGEIYGFHNIPGCACGEVILPAGTFACASTGLEIRLFGKQTHAAYPEHGINPADTIAELICRMNGRMRQPHRGIVLGTVIGMEAGSRSYGVAAGEGTLRLTLRAEHPDEYSAFAGSIERDAQELARERGLGVEITRIEEFPATVNDPVCAEKVRVCAQRQGQDVVRPAEPFRWSEDFGHYLEKTKGAFYGIGCGVQHPALHTMEYEFEDGIIEPAIGMFRTIAGL